MTMQMSPPTSGVGDRVRGIAAQKRVRQTELGAALGVGRMAVTRRLSGEVPLTDRELIVLAELLGVKVGAFFGEVGT